MNYFILMQEESGYNNMIDTMFKDSFDSLNMCKIEENIKYNIFLRFLKRSQLIKYSDLFLEKILSNKYKISNTLKHISDDNSIYVVFLNSSFIYTRYEVSTLKKIKEKNKKLKYILLYIDIVDHYVSQHANYLRKNNIFDLVYTVDSNDANNYGFILWTTPYCKKDFDRIDSENSDIYFCGSTKGRANHLKKIIDFSKDNYVRVQMDIICDEKEGYILDYPEVNLYPAGNYMAYNAVLQKTLNTRCILDVVQNGQNALTLRPYEAVVYNKKLLTNNPEIKKFSFYNEKYMQYYEDESTIDWTWVLTDELIDYRYNNEFTSNNLLNDIVARLG